MASKQPQRSNLKSDLKFMAQTTYATMFVWTVLTFFDHFDRRKKKKNQLTSTRPVGFAAGKNDFSPGDDNQVPLAFDTSYESN